MFDLEALKRNEEQKRDSDDEVINPEIHFDPIVKLNPVEIKTLEEDEEELFKVRAKLYRFDSSENPPQFKERGVGILKLLKHKTSGKIRILMRREQTLKICANHYLNTGMKLTSNKSSEKTWLWTALRDFADETPKDETLACRFMTLEDANKFKSVFEDSVESLRLLVNGETIEGSNKESLKEDGKASKSEEKETKNEVRKPEADIKKEQDKVAEKKDSDKSIEDKEVDKLQKSVEKVLIDEEKHKLVKDC